MRYIIIEDETLAADSLEVKIQKIRPAWACKAKLESIEESISFFKENKEPADHIFCDIHLSDGNSFKIFKVVDLSLPVIFTTAFDQYAIEAFDIYSVHYLLKPIKESELKKSILKFENQYSKGANVPLEDLQALISKNQVEYKSRLMVKRRSNMLVVPVEDIAYFYAKEGLVYLRSKDDQEYMVSQTLEKLEEELDPKFFFRASRQFLIHIQAVKHISPWFNSKLLIELEPEIEQDCVVSAAKSNSFKNWLDA